MGLILDSEILTTGNIIYLIGSDFMLSQESWVESGTDFGVGLIFGLGPYLPLTSCTTVGLSLSSLTSTRCITDVQKVVNGSVVLICYKIQSMAHIHGLVGMHGGLF